MAQMFSARWHRVARLVPRLASRVRVTRQMVRGERWYVLSHPVASQSVRLNTAAYRFAARLDGARSLQQLWTQAHETGVEVTQDEAIDMLVQLHEAGLLSTSHPADFDTLLPYRERIRSERHRPRLLSWRVPLGDPTAVLGELEPLQRLLFSGPGLALWATAMLVLVGMVAQHAFELLTYGQRWLVTPRFLLLATVLYVPIKLVHEIAHGLAVRRWGGQVTEAGVTFMLLLPVPYVNASAASSFSRRRHRTLVSAAGIAAELGLATVAMVLWAWLEEGMARHAAFATLVICGVSTLLFNANPLQRLDGYYIFCDALELPNLASRSQAWWQGFLTRRLLRVPGTDSMQVARGETFWLILYAPASWLMGIAIGVFAVAWAGRISLALGAVFASVLGWQMLLRPAWRLLARLRLSALGQARSARRWRRLSFGMVVAVLIALVLPLPEYTVAEGVVWPPDNAQLRVEESGFVTAVVKGDGSVVDAGDVVLQLASPRLETQHAQQLARVAALEAEMLGAIPGPVPGGASLRTGDVRAELMSAQAALLQLEQRRSELALKAAAPGRVALANATDLPGQFLRRGALLGQTLQDTPALVRVALAQERADSLRTRSPTVEVRLMAALHQARSATLLRDSGGATMKLPSAALSAAFGGTVLTDPSDTEHLQPLAPVVLVDVQLDADGLPTPSRIGERAWVRFHTGSTPVAWRLAQGVRRQVLLRFNSQF